MKAGAQKEEVLVAMEAVLPVKLSVSNLRQRVRVLARQLGVRMLIIDEIHSMLSGTFREQRIFLNALRFLANDLHNHAIGVANDARAETDHMVRIARMEKASNGPW